MAESGNRAPLRRYLNIVVNHVTRMQPGYICVAGLSLDGVAHIRPVLSGARRLGVDLLRRRGGVFDVAEVVNLGPVEHHATPPEVEDYLFDPAQAVAVNTLGPKEFWALLQGVAKKSLRDIFGPALERQNQTFAVTVGSGVASLGCLIPPQDLRIEVNTYDKIRLWMTPEELKVSLPVTDLRLYQTDHKTPRTDRVNNLAARIRAGAGVILSIGLTRAWHRPGDSVARHWLQVNNIHLADDPAWRVE